MYPYRRQNFVRVVLVALVGAIAAAGHPPVVVPYAALAGYAGALFILRGRGIAFGALGGFAFGSAMFGVLLDRRLTGAVARR